MIATAPPLAFPLLAIEVDGPHHRNAHRPQDALRNEAFEHFDVPLVRVAIGGGTKTSGSEQDLAIPLISLLAAELARRQGSADRICLHVIDALKDVATKVGGGVGQELQLLAERTRKLSELLVTQEGAAASAVAKLEARVDEYEQVWLEQDPFNDPLYVIMNATIKPENLLSIELERLDEQDDLIEIRYVFSPAPALKHLVEAGHIPKKNLPPVRLSLRVFGSDEIRSRAREQLLVLARDMATQSIPVTRETLLAWILRQWGFGSLDELYDLSERTSLRDTLVSRRTHADRLRWLRTHLRSVQPPGDTDPIRASLAERFPNREAREEARSSRRMLQPSHPSAVSYRQRMRRVFKSQRDHLFKVLQEKNLGITEDERADLLRCLNEKK